MATHLDLEEQEQLDQLKHFWKQYGDVITWVLVVALAAAAGWMYWNKRGRDQAIAAGAMYDEIDRAAQGGDAERAATVFASLKERFAGTAYAEQAGLLVAKVQFDKGQADNARATLAWVSEHATEDEYQAIARLRLAGVLMDQKKYDEALKQLDASPTKEFEALMADRRGDILAAQGKRDEAKAAYQKAWNAMDAKVEYRNLVEAKLTALGAPPQADKPKAAEAAK